ncbi:MAG: UDP-3-O-(3-hydroxymyristoyl)glucosamine N-acyltransferase [Pseudomonadota bacterium]
MKISLGEITARLGLELVGDGSLEISGIGSLTDAEPGQLTFLFNSAYKPHLASTRAAAVVLRPEDAADCPIAAILSPRPRMTWAQVAGLFDPTPVPTANRHPSAQVDSSARVGEQVSIGANAVIEANASLQDGAIIGAGCYVGEGAVVGPGSRLFANVTLYHDVVLGADCIVHSGAVLGADGFGFEFDAGRGTMVKIPQVYGVRVGDRVEIGAGTTIDRGALNHTLIGDGVKLDNQVQVGHGTRIGANTVISGCTAIAGSTRIGAYCLIGGAVGIIDNIEITDQVEITAMSLVSQSILERGRYSSGTGLMPGKLWRRNIVGFRKLDELVKRVRRLEVSARITQEK